MKAVDEKTSDITKRLESEDEHARFVEAEKAKLDKIAEHQAKIAARKAAQPSDDHKSAPDTHKHPDRVAIHDAIDGIKNLGYLHPIERKTLLRNVVALVRQSIIIDGSRSEFERLTQVFADATVVPETYQGCQNTWINNGTQSKQIPVGDEMPRGWVLGRIVTERMKAHQKKITAAAAIINKTSFGNAHGSRWYTNGELNIQVRPGVKPPEGFILGRHFNIEQKKNLLKNLKSA